MTDDPHRPQLEALEALTGTWTTEGSHPLLPSDEIRGEATFEWLEGGPFLVWRAHYEHPQIPDAISVIGVVDDRLSMHYFDTRGVHRVYGVDAGPGTWNFRLDSPEFSQRHTGTFDDTGDTMTIRGQMSRDGRSWEEDLQLTYRRISPSDVEKP